MTDNTNTGMTPEEIADFKASVKAQIVQEMKDDQALALEEAAQRRKQEAAERLEYFNTMKKSPDPWVEIIGWVETDKGVKVELEWNDAFVDFLTTEGVTGTDEDQIVQKWVALLLQNVAADMGDIPENENGSEFAG